MPKHDNQLCGRWGPFLYGDPLIINGLRWRVAMADILDVPIGYVPFKPEDEEAESITGIMMMPIDDLLDCRA